MTPTPPEPSAEARAEAHKFAPVNEGMAGMFTCMWCRWTWDNNEEPRHDPTCEVNEIATALDAKNVEIERLSLLVDGIDSNWQEDRQYIAGLCNQPGIEPRVAVKRVAQERGTLAQQLAIEREQKSEQGIIITALKSDLRDRGQQLEQAVRLLDKIATHDFLSYEKASGGIYEGQYGIGVVDGHRCCASIVTAFLSSPAIAPIVERVKGGGNVNS